MVSKTSLLPLVRAFDAKAVDAALAEKPELVAYRDERKRNWLHIACATQLNGRDAKASIRTADVLMKHSIDLGDHAFTEGAWKATPVWFSVSHGQNLKLAEHLMKLGASPQYSLYAAAYNRDVEAIRLLVKHGADIEERTGGGATPLIGAVQWSHFESAEAMAKLGADVNAQDERGMTALHYMLKKGSEFEHFEMLAKFGARGDIADRNGVTAAEVMARKKDPRFRTLAERIG